MLRRLLVELSSFVLLVAAHLVGLSLLLHWLLLLLLLGSRTLDVLRLLHYGLLLLGLGRGLVSLCGPTTTGRGSAVAVETLEERHLVVGLLLCA